MKRLLSPLLCPASVAVMSMALVAGGLGLGGCASRDQDSEMMRMQKSAELLEPLPVPARLALERFASGGVVTALSTDEFEGRNVYTADYLTGDGLVGHAQVTSDGRILANYTETTTLPVAEAPEAVRDSLRAHTGGAPVNTLSVEKHSERESRYIALAKIAGVNHRFTFDSTGSLVSESTQITATQVPPGAAAALTSRFPGLLTGKGAMLWETRDRNGAVTYSAEGRSAKRKIRAVATPSGTIQSVMYLPEEK